MTNARDGETPRPNETELVAGPADRATMVEALALFAQGLESMSIQETFLEYGWGCNLDTPHLWTPIRVNTANLAATIFSAEALDICQLGRSDLFVTDPQRKITLLFCHESHIHVTTNRDEYLALATSVFSALNLHVFARKPGGP
ncbi:MAG: hypothetical protein K2X35_18575 [Bryobacteraceae bacterium]|nr:hypothetical protein [Bryobacteraceae bacterium]